MHGGDWRISAAQKQKRGTRPLFWNKPGLGVVLLDRSQQNRSGHVRGGLPDDAGAGRRRVGREGDGLATQVVTHLGGGIEGQRDDADSYSEMKEYAAQQGYKWYYAVDANNVLADEFGANRTPECFLFNAEGKHVYHGAIDDNPGDASSVSRKHLKMAMDEMTSGKDVSVKESRSMGCQIKRKE